MVQYICGKSFAFYAPPITRYAGASPLKGKKPRLGVHTPTTCHSARALASYRTRKRYALPRVPLGKRQRKRQRPTKNLSRSDFWFGVSNSLDQSTRGLFRSVARKRVSLRLKMTRLNGRCNYLLPPVDYVATLPRYTEEGKVKVAITK